MLEEAAGSGDSFSSFISCGSSGFDGGLGGTSTSSSSLKDTLRLVLGEGVAPSSSEAVIAALRGCNRSLLDGSTWTRAEESSDRWIFACALETGESWSVRTHDVVTSKALYVQVLKGLTFFNTQNYLIYY